MTTRTTRQLVLVLEDRKSDAYIIEKAIERLGIAADVVVAASVAAAKARLLGTRDRLRHLPDLVIVDLVLTDGNGMDLVEWARAQSGLELVRFVVVSNYADQETIGRAYEAGVHSFIAKEAVFTDEEVAAAAMHYWLGVNEPLHHA